LRNLAEVEPHTAILWFNGNSESVGKGSVMVYIPEGGSYTRFYCAYSALNGWHFHRVIGITRQEFLALISSQDRPALTQ
jgi:hypothetical protein